MIESMLEPHLKRKAGASQSDVGITFLILGGVYMISSPIGGLVSMGIFNYFQGYGLINLTAKKILTYQTGCRESRALKLP